MTSRLDLSWRKSSYSGTQGGNCVELAPDKQGLLVRDSKAPQGGMLAVADVGAQAFLAAVKAGLYQR